MDELLKRCGTICGEDRTCCFVSNKNHLECVTDIIINKIWAAREIINMGTKENTCEHMAGILNIAIVEMDELIKWTQKIRTLKR